MSIKFEWAKYLCEAPEYENIVTNKKYLEAWGIALNKSCSKAGLNELLIVSGKLTIRDSGMILEYALVNQTKNPVKDIEIGVSLSILGKDYFEGTLRTEKDCYDPLLSNSARIDLINFGNDRYENQELAPKEYELKVHFCKEINYLDD